MSHTIGKWVRFRIALVVIGLILLGTVICGRFFYLQVIKGPQLRELATREYQKLCPVLPVRGMIVDRKGLELAMGPPGFLSGGASLTDQARRPF